MNRKCTDILCLGVFILFCSGMVGAGIYGFLYGEPSKLFASIDADGHFCGIDSGYENYPYLYFSNLEASDIWLYTVCVSTCPTANSTIDCHTTTNVTDCNSADAEHYDTYGCKRPHSFFSLSFISKISAQKIYAFLCSLGRILLASLRRFASHSANCL